jgi:TM2 domain-containing membrane protein YozV
MSDPVCPYCRMPFEEGEAATLPPKIFCTACGMPHHEDCYRENGGCTVFGCKCAPADDPKLQVSQNDLTAVSVPAQQYGAVFQQSVPQQSVPQSTARYGGTSYSGTSYSGTLGLSQAAAPALASAPLGHQYAYPAAYGRSYKSRTTYIVLGIFLGFFGVHNFYSGYTGRAVGQLCLTVLTLGTLGIVSWIWAIVEICIVDKDSTGLNFS